MPSTLTQPDDPGPYATREDIEELREFVQQAVDGFRHLCDVFAESSLGRVPSRPPALQPARAALRLVTDESERLILEAARR